MNTLEFYRKIENNDEIRDIFEGVTKLIPFSKIYMNTGDSWEDIEIFEKSPLGYFAPNSNKYNIFCLYAIFSDDNRSLVEHLKINNSFGDTTLIIYNPKEFIRRIEERCITRGLKHFCSRVQYFSEYNLPEKISPFNKRDKYSHQKEVRLVIQNKSNNPIVLHIGSIEDIATIIKM